ncbi:MAG: RNA methyltransferase [Anaerolineae bacterium]|nr:RNA methyltransferase [Anaerolineae bacterium]
MFRHQPDTPPPEIEPVTPSESLIWRATLARQNKLAGVVRRRQQGVVILEDIRDPHNAEAVFRTCDAFGIQHVCLVFDRLGPFDPREIGSQSSSSANKWLDFSVYNSIEACVSDLRLEGYTIAATVLSGRARALWDADFTHPHTAILLGNEHTGLTERAIALADTHIVIPMAGVVQSLNLSVTAALCLAELTRQRRAHGMEAYRLPLEEQHALWWDLLGRGKKR